MFWNIREKMSRQRKINKYDIIDFYKNFNYQKSYEYHDKRTREYGVDVK